LGEPDSEHLSADLVERLAGTREMERLVHVHQLGAGRKRPAGELDSIS
jgi:hypothetical protein